MKKYSEYRDSGIEWMGVIPKHWQVKRLKFLVQNIIEKTKSHGFHIALENIESGTGKYIVPDNSSELSGDMKSFKIGDILFNKLRPYLAKVYLAKQEGNCVGELLVLRPEQHIESKFIFYRLLSRDFIEIVNGSTYGAKMPRANWEDFIRNLLIPYPNFMEQTAIANFLDHKTQQIDDLIAKKERLIELLNEERAAVINQAVTKGLDPNVLMKDSGIEWLGEIPKHWQVKRLKYAVKINQEVLSETTDENYEFSYIDIGNVSSGRLNNEPASLTFKDAPSRARRIVHTGDTIISTVRTYLKAITFINDNLNNHIVSTGFAVLTPAFISEKFNYYIATSDVFVETVCAISVGVSYPATNASDIGNIQIWLPPLHEQEEISKFIEGENIRIECLINQYNRQVELLRELKVSLINETVTGKIDIRNKM